MILIKVWQRRVTTILTISIHSQRDRSGPCHPLVTLWSLTMPTISKNFHKKVWSPKRMRLSMTKILYLARTKRTTKSRINEWYYTIFYNFCAWLFIVWFLEKFINYYDLNFLTHPKHTVLSLDVKKEVTLLKIL